VLSAWAVLGMIRMDLRIAEHRPDDVVLPALTSRWRATANDHISESGQKERQGLDP